MYDPMLIKVWLGLQIGGGQIGVPILLATLYFSSLKRLKTLHNLLVTWLLSGITSSLLYYAGRAMPTDPEPGYKLCLIQSAMIYSAPPLTSASALALIYDGWIVITGRALAPNHPITIRRNLILLSVPWIIYVIFAVVSLFLGALDSPQPNRDRHLFYCSFKNDPLTNSVAVWTGLTILIAAVFTVRAARKLWRYWQTIKVMVEDPDAAESAMGSPYAILRIGIFGLNLFMAFVLSVVSIFGPKSPLPDLLAGTVPVSVFVIFGTQQDILLVWLAALRSAFNFILRRNPSSTPSSPPPPSPPSYPPLPRSAALARLPQVYRGPDGKFATQNSGSDDGKHVTVVLPNSFNVWKEKYLDQKTPPVSMWLPTANEYDSKKPSNLEEHDEYEFEVMEDDFEGFGSLGEKAEMKRQLEAEKEKERKAKREVEREKQREMLREGKPLPHRPFSVV